MTQLYTRIVALFAAHADKERGATMVEYGLMLALIAVVALGAVQAVGGGVTNLFNTIAGAL
jgi:pilus assembly protein Flp/PilA